MEFLKFALVIFAGLGLTWASGVVVPVRQVEDTSSVVVAQAQTAPNSTEVEDAEFLSDSEDVEVDLDEMTQEDIDAELAKSRRRSKVEKNWKNLNRPNHCQQI